MKEIEIRLRKSSRYYHTHELCNTPETEKCNLQHKNGGGCAIEYPVIELLDGNGDVRKVVDIEKMKEGEEIEIT